MTQKEVWLPIKGYGKRYLVSNKGNIFSKKRGINLALCKNSAGYNTVRLYDGGGLKTRKSFLIHQLVARAFIKKVREKYDVNHKDGNKTNNNASNLEWCNDFENFRHAFTKLGKTSNRFQFTDNDIKYIKSTKELGTILAKKYNVTKHTIYDIRKNRTWRNIK